MKPEEAAKTFMAVHAAIDGGLVESCHDLSEGGLAVAVADSYVLPSDTASTINAAQGVLANDLNPDSAAINAIREADVSSGSL